MIGQILSKTPIWVWGIFAGLIWLGVVQSRPRTMKLSRVVIIPIVITVFSVMGTVSVFGTSPAVLSAWLAAAAVCIGLVLSMPLAAGNRFDPQTQKIHVMGSWIPLALMMGIFINKYFVGVMLGIHPEMAQNASFSLAFSAIYGAFSGLFIGRTARLWRLQKSVSTAEFARTELNS